MCVCVCVCVCVCARNIVQYYELDTPDTNGPTEEYSKHFELRPTKIATARYFMCIKWLSNSQHPKVTNISVSTERSGEQSILKGMKYVIVLEVE